MKMSFVNGKWRQQLHLEPPVGWLNDPNGLSFFGGYYHVYFQYAPDNADGSGKKCWGHYRSRDMISREFTGTVLFPDTPDDKDGVYSGSAVVCGDTLHIFYTGNVKEEGEHDYITSGRGANVIHVTTKDGVTMSQKKTVLRNSDYPDFCSCHVRDPKVWREGGKWHMVLGARTLLNKGCVLFYTSDDLDKWEYMGTDSVPDFGYMWECPDMFTVGGHRYLSVSPQGLEHYETKNQNAFQSGYFLSDSGLTDFTEWDMGFDFYAPQTFEAPDGRRIIIGWFGIGDSAYTNPTTALGYQHCLTIPREVTSDEKGRLMQNPARELLALRKESRHLSGGDTTEITLPSELTADVHGSFKISFDGKLELVWDGKIFELRFTDNKYGSGRTTRKAVLDKCSDIRIIADTSSLEIYLDGGRTVFGTRFYPDDERVNISAEGISAEIYSLREMEVKYLGE
mgnify:FL=1